MSFELPRRWSTVVNVIDYMPGDTLLHRLNPVVKWARRRHHRRYLCPTPTWRCWAFGTHP